MWQEKAGLWAAPSSKLLPGAGVGLEEKDTDVSTTVDSRQDGEMDDRWITTLATLEDNHPREDFSLRPLLKASPPMPVASAVGQYRIFVARTSLRQPFGITLQTTPGEGGAILLEERAHLGIRQGDELVEVNGAKTRDARECRKLLETSLFVELVLQRRDPAGGKMALAGAGLCPGPSGQWQSQGPRLLCSDQYGGSCVRPAPSSTPLLTLLAASSPTQMDDEGEFEVTIQRMSLAQRFGVHFAMEERGGVVISEDMPHLRMRMGDVVLRVNGQPAGVDTKRVLDRSMLVTLRLRRDIDPEEKEQTNVVEDGRYQHHFDHNFDPPYAYAADDRHVTKENVCMLDVIEVPHHRQAHGSCWCRQ